MTQITDEFLRAVPKTDLHLHLDGSLRLTSLIEMAAERGVELPSQTVAGLRETVFLESYSSLAEYLHGFMYTCAVLRDGEALERAAYELAVDCFSEGTRYFEVRFAPQLHANDNLSIEQVLVAVAAGLGRAEVEFNQLDGVVSGTEPQYRSGMIVCAMRLFTEGFSPYYSDYVGMHSYRPQRDIIALASVDLARAAVDIRNRLGLPIVGFDLAGREDGYPASAHREAYAFAHRNFMKKTVHAGEAFGPESIFQAITELNADRIGHGYHLFSPDKVTDPSIEDPEAYAKQLAEYIADRRVTIEVCLTSNMQTNPEIGSIERHHLGLMLDRRLSVTLCTDNRLISNTTMCNEIRLAVDNFDVDARTLRNMVVYGFKRSFFPGSYKEKRAYVRSVIDYYDAVAARHGHA